MKIKRFIVEADVVIVSVKAVAIIIESEGRDS